MSSGDETYERMMEVFVAILAYAVENDEVFNVDATIMKTVFESMVENDTLPELSLLYDDKEKRMKFGVKLVPRALYTNKENEDGH